MSKYIRLFLKMSEEVEKIVLNENIEIEVALRKVKEKYKKEIKEVHDLPDQSIDHEQKVLNKILTSKRNISNRGEE